MNALAVAARHGTSTAVRVYFSDGGAREPERPALDQRS
jgi:hypothetical protein